jgi:hypothetical protein
MMLEKEIEEINVSYMNTKNHIPNQILSNPANLSQHTSSFQQH